VAKINPTTLDIIQQITDQMKVQNKSGETSIRMQLNPRELGAIEVKMTHNAQGVSVSFITEQSSTGQLLESQVSQLRQSLKDAGVQLTNLNISQHHQPHQEGGSFKQGQPFVPNPRRDVPQAEALLEERMRPQRIGSLTSEIDYLI
jgi:flagellar hook-length control protein FliK